MRCLKSFAKDQALNKPLTGLLVVLVRRLLLSLHAQSRGLLVARARAQVGGIIATTESTP